MRSGLVALWIGVALFPANGQAQALSCTVPSRLSRPVAQPPDEVRRLPVGGYTLALSWSPQHCRERGDERSFQCSRTNRFGFVVHGLWPDGRTAVWPQYCRPAAPLPEGVIRRNLCMTPSVELLQHEWARHGTCMTGDPARYFDRARGLFEGVSFPDMAALSRRGELTVGAFRRVFVESNRHVPGLTERSVRVRLTRGGWLDELWLCLDTALRHAPCRAGQSPGNRSADRMRIWRGS